MTTLTWIIVGGILMSSIAMVGSITLLLKPETLDRILLPLVAFAAGSLIGGAFFHMLPTALEGPASPISITVTMVAGFTVFFALEQLSFGRNYSLSWALDLSCSSAASRCSVDPLPSVNREWVFPG